MDKLTRRGFLYQTSIGVTATGMLAAAPDLVDSPTAPEQVPAMLSEPMLAHVRDVATGELSVLVGTREVIYRDPEFVARLLKATR